MLVFSPPAKRNKQNLAKQEKPSHSPGGDDRNERWQYEKNKKEHEELKWISVTAASEVGCYQERRNGKEKKWTLKTAF